MISYYAEHFSTLTYAYGVLMKVSSGRLIYCQSRHNVRDLAFFLILASAYTFFCLADVTYFDSTEKAPSGEHLTFYFT